MNSCLELDNYKLFLEKRKFNYIIGLDTDSEENYIDTFDRETIKECMKVYKNMHNRKTRYRKRVLKWVFYLLNNEKAKKEYKLVFGTLTFDNKALEFKKDTRRQKVRRFLQKNTIQYLANIDYGNENEREHYHYIAIVKKENKLKEWEYITNIKNVRLTKEDIKKTFNYVMKSVNHGFKAGTKLESVIYGQGKHLNIDKLIELVYQIEFEMFMLDFYKNLNEVYS